jgi:hypothetical protein
LRGVTVASEQQELIKEALERKPELVQGAGADGMSLSKLSSLLDELRPSLPAPPLDAGEEDEEEEIFEEDPTLR